MSEQPATRHPSPAEWLTAAQAVIRPLGSAVVAFSGGVDSSLVLKLAVLTLGRERVLAATARSPSVAPAELDDAARIAAEIGAEHVFVDTQEFESSDYLSNPTNRCYFCKTELYSRLTGLARRRGLAAVLNGVNADDLGDFRPGLLAADEHAVRAPLAEAGLDKDAVRSLAAHLGLSAHDKPASPCLSSRVPYGEPITPEKLAQVDRAESLLRSLGFRQCRVRHHGSIARIEIPAGQLAHLVEPQTRAALDAALRRLGFAYVTVDLRGLRSGSLNEVLLGPGLARTPDPPRGS